MVEMLEAGLSHELSLGVSAGLSFLPVTVGVCISSRSVLAKFSSGTEITMTRHEAQDTNECEQERTSCGTPTSGVGPLQKKER